MIGSISALTKVLRARKFPPKNLYRNGFGVGGRKINMHMITDCQPVIDCKVRENELMCENVLKGKKYLEV